MKMSKAQ